MDPVTIGLTIFKLAAEFLKDDDAMDAIFSSDALTSEQREAITAMRDALEDKWDALAPKD